MNSLSQRFLLSLFFVMIGAVAYSNDTFIFIICIIFFVLCYFVPIGKDN